jgi:hypothetical protein
MSNEPVQIPETVYIQEDWWKDASGTVWVQRWQYLGDGKWAHRAPQETPYKEVPFYKLDFDLETR